jgi:type I restriction enzyme S subunit
MKALALGDVARFLHGITFKPSDVVPVGSPGSVVCMRTKNVQVELDERDLISVPQRFVRREELYLREGDILVSSANSWNLVGKCCWVGDLGYAATAGGFISILRARIDEIDPRYLYHWFSSSGIQTRVRNCGRQTTNIANLDTSRCLALIVPLPPLSEQNRIAAILDKADALRRKRREAIAKLDLLASSVFLHLFGDPLRNPRGWRTSKVVDVAQVQGGLQLSSRRQSLPLQKRYLRVANVQRGHLDLKEIKTIGLTPEEHKKTRLLAGDLLLVEGNGNPEEIGRAAIWDGSIDECVHQNHLIRVRCDACSLSALYLNAYLNSPAGKAYFLRAGRTTSGLVTISTSIVKDCPVLLPPREIQREFEDWVGRIVEARQKHSVFEQKCEDLFQALQQQAFSATWGAGDALRPIKQAQPCLTLAF